MRLWTVHPKYLDSKGLVALWRESLLARKVLQGKTRGYKNHPQLFRFKESHDPVLLIERYIYHIYTESVHRGYNFDKSKLSADLVSDYSDQKQIPKTDNQITETEGQLLYEWQHLFGKLKIRDERLYHKLITIETPEAHPIFLIVQGNVRDWEKVIQYKNQ